ncbi:hypothetical protein PV326_001467, partial [Microctonus aethiopoides]
GDGAGMGYGEKEFWERLGKEDMALRKVGGFSNGLWGGDIWMEREGKNGEGTGEIFEVGVRSEDVHARIICLDDDDSEIVEQSEEEDDDEDEKN